MLRLIPQVSNSGVKCDSFNLKELPGYQGGRIYEDTFFPWKTMGKKKKKTLLLFDLTTKIIEN